MASLRWRHADLRRWWTALIILGILLAAAYLGLHPRRMFLALPIGILGGAFLLWHPSLGLGLLIVAALALRWEIYTGNSPATREYSSSR